MSPSLPSNFAAHFAIAIRAQIRDGVAEQLPELAPYWPLFAGFSYEAYWASDDAIAILLHHIPVSAVLVGNSQPKPIPDGVVSLPAAASLEQIRDWVSTFSSAVRLAPTDGVVVVPLADSADVPAIWDQWSTVQREIWATQINEVAARHFLIAQARKSSGDEPDEVAPLARATLHPSFAQPDELDAGLWRYMSMNKFVSLLDARSLWFSRADVLGDAHEGARSQVNLDRAAEVYPDASALQGLQRVDLTQLVYVNCWHLAHAESVAMWGMYTSGNEGVVVRTSFRRLQESLPKDRDIYVGLVSYVDYARTWIPEANLFDRFMRKRHYYEYEREVRAVFADWERSQANLEPGVLVPVDLANLVLEVVVAPGATDSVVDEVRMRARGAGVEAPIRRSDIDTDPVR